jgi:nitrite reductase/ring-hydroxylating ferredoxin subunit
MTQLETELDGPDFTQGVKISTVPDGTMLLGHIRGEAVLLVRRGDEVFAIGAYCRIMAPHLAAACLSEAQCAAPGIMRALA